MISSACPVQTPTEEIHTEHRERTALIVFWGSDIHVNAGSKRESIICDIITGCSGEAFGEQHYPDKHYRETGPAHRTRPTARTGQRTGIDPRTGHRPKVSKPLYRCAADGRAFMQEMGRGRLSFSPWEKRIMYLDARRRRAHALARPRRRPGPSRVAGAAFCLRGTASQNALCRSNATRASEAQSGYNEPVRRYRYTESVATFAT